MQKRTPWVFAMGIAGACVAGGPALATTYTVTWTGTDSSFADTYFDTGSVSMATPEPATWILLAVGFGGLGLAGWRGSRRSDANATV